MSIFTVCFTGVRVWVEIPGGPSAAATLALEEKECVEKRERGVSLVATNPFTSRHPGGGRCRVEQTPTLL